MYAKECSFSGPDSTELLTDLAGTFPHDSKAKRGRRTRGTVACEESGHGHVETASRGFESKNVRATMMSDIRPSRYEARASVSPVELLQYESQTPLYARLTG
jgi:hypothetical protein